MNSSTSFHGIPPSPAPPAVVTALPSTVQSSSSDEAKREAVSGTDASSLRSPPTLMYWARTPVSGKVNKPVRAHTTTLVDSVIWLFGGCDVRGNCFKDVWKLDTDTFNWTKPKCIGEVPPVTRAHTCTLYDKRLFIIGGGDGPTYYSHTYYLDTISHTWTKPHISGTLPSPRRAHTSILYQGRILVYGGGNGTTALSDGLHALDVSDINHLSWEQISTKGKSPIARGYHSLNLVGSKCILFGGSDGTECFSSVHILDLDTFTWSEVNLDPELSFPRLSHTSTRIGSYLFIIGGHDGLNFSNEVLLFNLVTLSFESRAIHGVPPSPRGYHSTILHDSRLILIGGFDGQTVFDSVFTLDLAGNAFLPQITNFEIVVEEDEIYYEDEGGGGIESVVS